MPQYGGYQMYPSMQNQPQYNSKFIKYEDDLIDPKNDLFFFRL
jgi:hypothetical protein